ncbi:hypothetical protein [Cellulomonas sp. URHB0016]
MSQARPGRRLPARVYWVRRFVVLGIPLLIVLAVVWLVAGRGAGGDTPAAAAPATVTAEPTPTKTPARETGGVPTCSADHLALSVVAAAESFPAGVSPMFAVTITNTGSEPCLVDAGDAHREIVITSGDDRVWSNQDCVAHGTETRALLLPAGGADAQQLAWNRIRSAVGCPDELPAPAAGTYSAAFTLAGAAAPPVVFGLG